MAIRDAEQLLLQEVRAIYQAEKLIARTLPKITRRVQNQRLRDMLEHRREESQHLVQDIEHGLEALGATRGRGRNEAAEGLVEQISMLQEDIEDPALLDAAILGGVQKLEHYCIGAWGLSRSLAAGLGHREIVEAMEQALAEGKRYDEDLTELAEREVNPMAIGQADDEDDEDDEDDDEEIAARGDGIRDRVPPSGGRGGRAPAGQGARGGARASGGASASSSRSGGGAGSRSGNGRDGDRETSGRQSGGGRGGATSGARSGRSGQSEGSGGGRGGQGDR